MLHLIMGNMVVNNLNGTLIVIVDCSQGLNRKSKFTQKLVNPDYLCTYMNNTMIFFFCSRQGDYLMFLSWPNQWSSVEAKHISRSGLLIITSANIVGVGEVDQ
jgi:hypothetical protein